MKKILLAAVVAFSSLAANAQIWVGGSLGANFKSVENGPKISQFTISPEVGYTLNDKWDIALAINTDLTSVEDADNTMSFSVEPYARYTFAKVGNVSFFLDGGFSFGTTNAVLSVNEKYELESSYVKAEDNTTTFTVGVRPGVKFAVNENLGLVAKLGWLGYKNVKDFGNEFGLNVSGAALSFGAYYCF